MKPRILFFLAVCLMLSACSDSTKPTLAPETIFEAKGLHVITSNFNKKLGTMSTLYGNGPALEAARNGSNHHVSGEIFTLVTWTREANPFWFGGNINGARQTVETVRVLPSEKDDARVEYEVETDGENVLEKVNFDKQERINFIFDQKASVFPSVKSNTL